MKGLIILMYIKMSILQEMITDNMYSPKIMKMPRRDWGCMTVGGIML